MTAAIALASLFLPVLVAAPPAAGAAYEPDARASYVEEALAAVRATDAKTRALATRQVVTLEGSTCASQFDRLTVECLVTAARRWCKSRPKAEAQRCPLLMDVVISNVLSEKEHLGTSERYEIMRTHKDYRAEIGRRVRRIQATIAADFEVRTASEREAAPLPKRIDRYCLHRADESDLSWQSCTSALVWFIGTEE